ncbi:MAG: hypothetical protein M0R80_09880 [Proteobacteria bacterium]|jgi:DNA repair protein RadC|nr:hypothetical protein [Pseudomonadota bacterium]
MENICKAVYEAVRSEYTADSRRTIVSPEDILAYKQVSRISGQKQEHVLVLTLGADSKVIRCRIITKGLMNHSLVHPREVFREAIMDNAHSIIIVHNHPSNCLTPSSADIEVTKQIVNAGKIIGIELLDHIIVAKAGIASLRRLGCI